MLDYTAMLILTYELGMTDCQVPLEGQDHVGVDGAAEGDVMQRVQEVHEKLQEKNVRFKLYSYKDIVITRHRNSMYICSLHKITYFTYFAIFRENNIF